MGGLDTNLKLKRVDDKDKVNATLATDDRAVLDNGVTVSVGNQLASDLYGTLSYGRYIRDITVGANAFNNSKSIYSLKFAYNLPGFEMGLLTQWIQGNGNPTEAATGQCEDSAISLEGFCPSQFLRLKHSAACLVAKPSRSLGGFFIACGQ